MPGFFVALVLLVAVTIVTLVGHGIWVLLASIFGAGTPPRKPGPPTIQSTRANCPRCDAALADGSCPVCKWPVSTAGDATREVLRDLAARIGRFKRLGLLNEAAHHRLHEAIVAESQTRPATAAPAAPVVPTVVEEAVEEAIPVLEIHTPPVEPVVPTAPAIPEMSVAASTATPRATGVEAPAPLTVRAHRYAESRAQAAAEPLPAAPPRAPRRSWSDLLAAFMEEKNIRWGELIGGLLIIGGSVAMVISFWAFISERPLYKFVVFNGVTAALFGLGFYSAKRWRLQTTSEGLLLIATLLVPLNFLAIAVVPHAAKTSDVFTILGELMSIALFAGLLWATGRIVLPKAALVMAAGVLVPSILQLLIRRFVGVGAERMPELLGFGAVMVAGAANLWPMFRAPAESEGDAATEAHSNAMFKLLGVTMFAALVATGLLVYKLHTPDSASHRLAPLVCVLGLAPLAVGLQLWRRLTSRALVGHRTTAMSIAVAGALLLVAGVVLAWPNPAKLIPSAAVAAAAFVFVAYAFRLPEAHLPAVVCVTILYLVGWCTLTGELPLHNHDTHLAAQKLVSGESGQRLVALVVVLGCTALGLVRARGRDDARYLAFGTMLSAAVSVALVSWFGFAQLGDPLRATWIYAFYALAAYVVADVAQHDKPERLGAIVALSASLALVLAAVLQGVIYLLGARVELSLPWPTAVLTAAAVFTAEGVALAIFGGLQRKHFSSIVAEAAGGMSLVALGLLCVAVWMEAAPGVLAAHWLALAGVWLALALVAESALVFTCFEIALALAVWFAVAARLELHDWFQKSAHPWLDPWTLSAEGIALVTMALAGILIRAGLEGLMATTAAPGEAVATTDSALHNWSGRLQRLFNPPWPTIDAVVLRVSLVLLVGLCAYAALPGVAQELSPRKSSSTPVAAAATSTGVTASANPAKPMPRDVPKLNMFELANIPHDHARGWAVWLLLALVVATLVVELIARHATWNVFGILLAAAMICPLAASAWQADVAVASALRWFAAGFLLVASVPVWMRHRLSGLGTKLGWPKAERWQHDDHDATGAIIGVFVLSLAMVVAMAVYLGAAATWRHPPDADVLWLLKLTFFGFVAAAVIALLARGWMVSRVSHSPPFQEGSSAHSINTSPWTTWAGHTSALLLILGAAPPLALTLFAVAGALRHSPILGPDPASLFGRMGLATSYAAPMLATALALVIYAVRERSARFAFAGSLVLNLGVTAAYLLTIAKSAAFSFNAVQWIRLAQLNAIVSAVYAIAWLAVVTWWLRRSARNDSETPVVDLLITQIAFPATLNLLVLAPLWWMIVSSPTWTGLQLNAAADRWGWAAALLTLVAIEAVEWTAGWAVSAVRTLVKGLALATLVACLVAAQSTVVWAGFHTLLALHVGLVALLAGGAWVLQRLALTGGAGGWLERFADGSVAVNVTPVDILSATSVAEITARPSTTRSPSLAWIRDVTRVALVAAVVATCLGIRGIFRDPEAPWWSFGAFSALAVFAAWLGCWSLRRGLVIFAALLVNLVACAWWFEIGHVWFANADNFTSFIHFNLVALGLPAIIWVVLERQVFQPAGRSATWLRLPPAHRLAARLCVVVLALLICTGLLADSAEHAWTSSVSVTWMAVAATVIATLACLWDAEARDSVALLYFAGLLVCGAMLDYFNLPRHMLVSIGVRVLAAYAVATSFLWSRRAGLLELADSVGIPRGSADEKPFAGLIWLVPANCLLSAVVVILAFVIELRYSEGLLRALAAGAALAQSISIGLLARGTRRSQLQYAALALGAIGVILLGWAPLDPGTTGNVLNRAVVVTVAIAAMAVLYGLGFGKLLPEKSEWLAAALRMTPVLVAVGAMSILFVLAVEGIEFAHRGHVNISWPAIAAVAVTLLGLSVAALAAAVLPGRDPLGLSERGRQAYVYGAEAVLVLLFVHIRLTKPEWFHGFFMQFWPLIVMLIAFVGAGMGEWLRRKRVTVLGDPLGNTGALLPMLPALGFWVMPAAKVHYSLVLLSIGLLYSGLSVARKSFGFGVLAALAANGGLWYFLHDKDGFAFLQHPQLWLIPPALCVLAAAHINRRQLSAEQMTAIRYGASTVVYVSSTADIFLTGVEHAPWLPLVLAGISLLGVFAGILMRVRAFLFLGTAFLTLAIFTIIWNAARGLGLKGSLGAIALVAGLLIVGLFAFFEKKRDKVLGLVNELKRWEK